LSTDAFAFDKKRLWLRALVDGLAKDAGTIASLKKARSKKK
jgi:hypothetical protein